MGAPLSTARAETPSDSTQPSSTGGRSVPFASCDFLMAMHDFAALSERSMAACTSGLRVRASIESLSRLHAASCIPSRAAIEAHFHWRTEVEAESSTPSRRSDTRATSGCPPMPLPGLASLHIDSSASSWKTSLFD